MKQNADLMDRLQELVGSVHVHQAHIAAQKNQIRPTDFITGRESTYMSEEEADLRYQHEHGYIDDGALKDALKQLGFENTELVFD